MTYHGPGQIVGYPIVSLRDRKIGVSDYVGLLEDAVIDVLATYGLESGRDSRNRGVWVGNSKIAAIGLRVRKHVSIHGFALNVSPDLRMYERIVPCGVAGAGVTSMQKESVSADLNDVKARLADEFVRLFGYAGKENVERKTIEKA